MSNTDWMRVQSNVVGFAPKIARRLTKGLLVEHVTFQQNNIWAVTVDPEGYITR